MKVFVDSHLPMFLAGRDHPLREPSRRFLEPRANGRRRRVHEHGGVLNNVDSSFDSVPGVRRLALE